MQLTNIIKDFNKFTETEILKIRAAFKSVEFEANGFLLTKGDINDKVYFIDSGLLREYSVYNEDGEDKKLTHWILAENEWIYQVESYLLEKPSACYIQAITYLKAHYITKTQLANLLDEVPALAHVLLAIYEKYLLQLESRNSFHRIKNAEKRLEVFEKMQPGILNRVSSKLAASYLNISPEQLSRIRSKRVHSL